MLTRESQLITTLINFNFHLIATHDWPHILVQQIASLLCTLINNPMLMESIL